MWGRLLLNLWVKHIYNFVNRSINAHPFTKKYHRNRNMEPKFDYGRFISLYRYSICCLLAFDRNIIYASTPKGSFLPGALRQVYEKTVQFSKSAVREQLKRLVMDEIAREFDYSSKSCKVQKSTLLRTPRLSPACWYEIQNRLEVHRNWIVL